MINHSLKVETLLYTTIGNTCIAICPIKFNLGQPNVETGQKIAKDWPLLQALLMIHTVR